MTKYHARRPCPRCKKYMCKTGVYANKGIFVCEFCGYKALMR